MLTSTVVVVVLMVVVVCPVMAAERGGAAGEHGRGPAPPQGPAGGPEDPGPRHQPAQRAAGGRGTVRGQDQGKTSRQLHTNIRVRPPDSNIPTSEWDLQTVTYQHQSRTSRQ